MDSLVVLALSVVFIVVTYYMLAVKNNIYMRQYYRDMFKELVWTVPRLLICYVSTPFVWAWREHRLDIYIFLGVALTIIIGRLL